MTLPTVYGIALSLLLFVVLANLAIFQYGRGVIRSALDEAARAGARTGAEPDLILGACQDTAVAAGTDLLGALGRRISFECAVAPDTVTARAVGAFDGWLPLVPDLVVDERATARREAPA